MSECDFLGCGAELPVDTTIDLGKTTTLTIRIDTGIRSPVGVPQGQGKEVTFDELFASPERYSGAEVVLTGFYFHGWETIVLSERLEPTGRAEGHLWPQGRKVWIEGDLAPADVYDQLYVQEMIGPEERLGKLRISGRFEYGEVYGHVGGFEAQIVPAVVELLEWSPLPVEQE